MAPEAGSNPQGWRGDGVLMRKEFSIAGKKVGPGHPCFIIAEPGSNHNGDLQLALQLIDAAAAAGADAIKFQTFRASEHYSRKTPQFSYLKKDFPDVSTFELIRRNEMPRSWHGELRKRCEARNIIFLSTPSDRSAVDELVDEHQMASVKIASFEAVDLPFIDYCARKGKPMIVSTGMCDLEEIHEIVETVRNAGNETLALLHCISLYPTKPEWANLRAMATISQATGVPVGFSDHTEGIAIPVASAALGCAVIEKHFTLDRKMKGPDHPFAVEPHELKEMVLGMRKAEAALGTGDKKRLPEEEEMARLGRRSIISRVRIEKGAVIEADMLTAKRPGYGIKPKFLSQIVGKRAKQTIEEDDVVTWEMV